MRGTRKDIKTIYEYSKMGVSLDEFKGELDNRPLSTADKWGMFGLKASSGLVLIRDSIGGPETIHSVMAITSEPFIVSGIVTGFRTVCNHRPRGYKASPHWEAIPGTGIRCVIIKPSPFSRNVEYCPVGCVEILKAI